MLQQVVKDHPYFSAAQFFLLKSTDVKDVGYDKIAAKTALHFHNTFLLQSQLHKAIHSIKAELQPASSTTVNAVEEVEEDEVLPANVLVEQAPEEVNVNPTVETFYESIVPADHPEMPKPASDAVEEPKTATPAADDNKSATFSSEPALATPVSLKQSTLTPAIPMPEGSMLFTPLYATDYFASQGIKLREEALHNDKLGKQLKSFTDWLKTMKKVHDNKLPGGNEAMDASVQKLAEKSNKEEVVVTETMAEVFLQQGKLHKAKEIYEKLSLLSPSKIAYFAAKIDQIQQK